MFIKSTDASLGRVGEVCDLPHRPPLHIYEVIKMDVEKDRTVDMICIMFEPKDESGITYQGFSLTFKKAEELSRRISALLLKYEN